MTICIVFVYISFIHPFSKKKCAVLHIKVTCISIRRYVHEENTRLIPHPCPLTL